MTKGFLKKSKQFKSKAIYLTISHTKETALNLVKCSESNASSNFEPVEHDLIAEESQVSS